MPPQAGGTPPRGILELDRFSEANLAKWKEVSEDLDELNGNLYWGIEPARRRHRADLLAALSSSAPLALDLDRWVRIVTYQFSLQPLSAAGSLMEMGGRYNAGIDLDENTLAPWPALYLAQDFETAYREKFQLKAGEQRDGLTPEELALQQGVSHASVFLRGRLHQVFDLTTSASLHAAAAVFRKIALPVRARELQRRLQIPPRHVAMAQTAGQIHKMVVEYNWRMLPVQFGLPAHSHILAELIRAAGFEAILYPSSKGGGHCLAVFPERLRPNSYIELVDPPPAGAHTVARLDDSTGQELCGWDAVLPQYRPA